MSLSVEIFDHPNAGFYYVIFQHNDVYQMNAFNKGPDQHCVKLGELWPNGEFALGLKLGDHLRIQDVPRDVLKKISSIITNTITHV